VNAQNLNENNDELVFDIAEVCEEYPDDCEFCDYNLEGYCALYRVDLPEDGGDK